MKKKLLIILLTITLFSTFVFVACDPDKDNISKDYPDYVTFMLASESEDGYATVYAPEDKDLKVLFLSDPQTDSTEKYSIVGSSNEKTYTLLFKLMDATKPDLVLISGDLAMCAFMNNWIYFKRYCEIFEEKQIPWAFVFGNHDCENSYVSESANISSKAMQLTKEKLIAEINSKYSYCLTTAGNVKNSTGNFFINVRRYDGSLIYSFCNFDCAYEGDSGYSHVITPEQVDWYEATVNALSDAEYGADRTNDTVIKTIVNTHVGLPEFYTAYKEAFDDEGQPIEGKYFYGYRLGGDYSSYIDDTDFYDRMLALGSTTAVFFGHHHDNDASVDYKGIRLTFVQHSGLSHDYRTTHSENWSLGWPEGTVFDFTNVDTYGDKRGGTMVTFRNGTENYDITPVYASEVISDYSDFAIDYDAVAAAILQMDGGYTVIRADD